MVKEKKILSYFIGWLIIGICILFVGINNVFALVINSSFMGTSISSEFNINSGSYKSDNTSITVDESNALNYLVVDICSTMHGNYSISNISNQSGNVSFYKGYYISGTCALSNYNGAHIRLYYKVNSWADAGNGNYGLIFNSRFNNNASYQGYVKVNSIYTLDTLDPTVANIEQSDKLNSSIQNSTDTITGEIDNMEQNIIDSNKETQDVIKDQFKTCRPSKNLWPLSTSYTTATGNEYVLRDTPITIKPGTYTISFKNSSNTKVLFNFKDSSGNSKEVYFENTYQQTVSFSKEQVLTAIYIYDRPTTISEIQFQSGTTATKFEEPGKEICTNRIDETNDKLDGIQGALTDTSTPNLDGLENSIGWLPPGPVDSILNLPLIMLNSLTNSLSKTCSPLSIKLPYVNKNIQIPCLSAIFSQITGVNGLWTWVGAISSVLILYNYLLNLYAWVDKVLTLRAEFDEAMGADLANWGRL